MCAGRLSSPACLPSLELEPELRRDDDPIANGRQRFADEFLVREWPVGLGGIEKRDASLDGCTNDRRCLLHDWSPVRSRS